MTKMKHTTTARMAIAALALLTCSSPAFADDPADATAQEIRELRAQIALLQQRLDAVEQREAQKQADPAPAPAAAAPAPGVATVQLGSKGVQASTADKNFGFQIRTRIQADAHFFASDDGNDEFYLRRAIVSFRGNAGKLNWVFSPNFGGSSTIIEDAWIDYGVSDAFHLHVGKVTSVEGFENFQSNARILFAERSLANNLIPGREIGLKAVGSFGKVFSYGLTLTNGALDGCAMNSSANLSDDLLYSALVTIKPFAGDKDSPLAGLSFGIAASIGEEDTSIDGSTDRTLKFRTAGRNAFLTVQNGVAVKGDRHRLNPQLSYYYGPLGVLAEYVQSSYEMSRGGVAHTIDNSGWTVQASYVLTGEKNTFGGVKPDHPFNLDGDGMGAFELGLRYNVFSGDEDLFSGSSSTMLASSSSVQDAEAFGILFKWHLSENLLWALNYEVTDFDGLGAERDTEKAVTTRFQIDF